MPKTCRGSGPGRSPVKTLSYAPHNKIQKEDRQVEAYALADRFRQRTYAWNLKMQHNQLESDRFYSSRVRSMLIGQCKKQNIKVFFKQWSGFRPKSGWRTISRRICNKYTKLKLAVSKKQSIKWFMTQSSGFFIINCFRMSLRLVSSPLIAVFYPLSVLVCNPESSSETSLHFLCNSIC